jgi:hypothetical protein
VARDDAARCGWLRSLRGAAPRIFGTARPTAGSLLDKPCGPTRGGVRRAPAPDLRPRPPRNRRPACGARGQRARRACRALDASPRRSTPPRPLERGRQALEAGREPLEGERIGTYSGRARLNDAYWERQAANEYAVAEAEARLERARRALIELR